VNNLKVIFNCSRNPLSPACKVSPSHLHFICWRHMGVCPHMSGQVGVIGVIWGRCPRMSGQAGVIGGYVAAFLARVRSILGCLVQLVVTGSLNPWWRGGIFFQQWRRNLLPAMARTLLSRSVVGKAKKHAKGLRRGCESKGRM
jgi:hypothetical protein